MLSEEEKINKNWKIERKMIIISNLITHEKGKAILLWKSKEFPITKNIETLYYNFIVKWLPRQKID